MRMFAVWLLAASLSLLMILSHLQTSPSHPRGPAVPHISPGSQPLEEEHTDAQPQPDVHRLPGVSLWGLWGTKV